MINELPAHEYGKLSKLLIDCETIMQDEFLKSTTNVVDVYKTVLDEVIYQTDPYLEIIYQIPHILKPIA